MRIIGGRLKGKTIDPPQGYKARPTTDFAREGLFNVLNNEYELEGLQVLDLFGGTGAISFEFASRGASMVYCVEMLPLHSNFIRSQAAKFGLKNMTVVRHNVFEFLEICREKFDIVFADPPYALDDLASIPDKVFARNILHPGAYFILEHPKEFDFSSHAYFLKEKKYGNVHFSFFEAPSGQGESSDRP
jgi:16S rRNA (guanine(966)-N(2))-methyltransferase RsmD